MWILCAYETVYAKFGAYSVMIVISFQALAFVCFVWIHVQLLYFMYDYMINIYYIVIGYRVLYIYNVIILWCIAL